MHFYIFILKIFKFLFVPCLNVAQFLQKNSNLTLLTINKYRFVHENIFLVLYIYTQLSKQVLYHLCNIFILSVISSLLQSKSLPFP